MILRGGVLRRRVGPRRGCRFDGVGVKLMLYQNGNEIIGLGGVNVCRSQALQAMADINRGIGHE